MHDIFISYNWNIKKQVKLLEYIGQKISFLHLFLNFI